MSLFLSLTPRADAWRLLCEHLPEGPRAVESVSLVDAIGRCLAHDVLSPTNLPGFARSTMDGYALRAADSFGASEALPALVEVAGEVAMGQAAHVILAKHSCVKVATGAMIPEGADSVVMVEHTERVDSSTIAVLRPVAPGENVMAHDEDVARGTLLLPRGRALREHDIAALAAVGIIEVDVAVGPRVAIVSTGDELVDVADVPQPGQVRDMNSFALCAAVSAAGGRPEMAGIVRDDFDSLLATLRWALAGSDMVVLSGGSSIGARDYARQAIAALGEPGVLVHGVAVKPGKPTIVAMIGGKPVFGLPGHPASCLNIFRLFVEPAIGRWMGTEPTRREIIARIGANVASAAGREDYVAVKLVLRDGVVWAEPLFAKSAMISGLTEADGIARIPEESEGLLRGDAVTVVAWR
jgi:molybdopterin molybdotransferase